MKNNKSLRGVAILEFSFVMLTLIPLLLGSTVVGVNMVRSMQTVQLGRDAGHMYARGVDFSQLSNQTILATIGSGTGLSTTAGSGNAVVILSGVTYIDKAMCLSAGLAVDTNGDPIGCTNLGSWVFTQRLVIGKSSVHASNFGSPAVGGSTGVTPNATTGVISLSDQATKSGDVATFSGVNPYSNVSGVISGLPSGQAIYIAEAAAVGFSMAPFMSNALHYSYNMF
jgi:hypothetical protein